MAFTKLIFMATLIAIASAGFVWQDDDDDDKFGSKMWPPMPPLMNPFPQGFPFNNMPPMQPIPPIPPIKFPSPDEIKNTKPRKGLKYSGVSVVNNNGEVTMVANVDGKVYEKKIGKKGDDSKGSKKT